MLTAEILRELLHYNPETGVFTWSKPGRGRRLGIAAGCIDNEGYRRIRIGPKLYKAHRLAWLYVTGEWPSSLIDHINGVVDDNRITNLRLADYSQNTANSRTPRTNTSGYKGVSFDKKEGKFSAAIRWRGPQRRLGLFNTAEEAHQAYAKEAVRLHGEFMRLK